MHGLIWVYVISKNYTLNKSKLNIHKMSRTSPESLMYVQFASCVQGVCMRIKNTIAISSLRNFNIFDLEK